MSVLVYEIACTATGKKYIGITSKTLEQRWRQHLKDSRRETMNTVFYRAVRKYGEEAFVIGLLYEAVDAREAQAVERALIAQYATLAPSGLNTSTGGESYAGRRMSQDVRAKISAAKKGQKIPREAVERGAAKRRGRKWSEEQRERQAVAFSDPGVRDRMLAGLRSRNESGATSKRSSATMKHLWEDPAFRERRARDIAALNERKKARAAQRAAEAPPKRSKREAMLERWQDPVYRGKMLAKQEARQRAKPDLEEAA